MLNADRNLHPSFARFTPPESTNVPADAKRLRLWWVVLLSLVIGLAAYRIGLWIWGNRQLQEAETALAKREWSEAQRALDRCFWVWPDKPDLHLLAARAARGQGRTHDAQRHLDRCLADGSLRESVILERRLLRVQAGDLDAAEGMRRFMDEQPAAAETGVVVEALVAGNLARLQTAEATSLIDWWDKHRTSPADKLLGILWRADVHWSASEFDQARTLYRQALDLDPDSRQARLMLVGLLAHDAPAEAQSHLSVLLAREPDEPELLFQQALIDRNLGRTDQARQALDRVLAERPDWIEALVRRGLVELDTQQPQAAARWLDEAERISPKHREVLLARIEYLRQTGQAAEVEPYQEKMKSIEADVLQRVKTGLEAMHRARGEAPAAK
jgi:tetratricopeptide (TPR) repeat protein